MTGYKEINLTILLEEIGEEKTKKILADYSCPRNADNAPNYNSKEKLISLLNHFDVNQTSTIGKHRITQYEV